MSSKESYQPHLQVVFKADQGWFCTVEKVGELANVSVFHLYNNANANVDTHYKSGRHNTCEQLWNGAKKKTDVGGDGFLRARGNNGIICRVSCLRFCCAPSYGRSSFIYLQESTSNNIFHGSQDF